VSLLAITNGYAVLFPGQFTAASFLVSYIVFVIFFILYFGHKLWYKTPWMTKASDIDISTGKEEIDRLTEEEIEPIPRNWWEKSLVVDCIDLRSERCWWVLSGELE
jgi:amino acid transporter